MLLAFKPDGTLDISFGMYGAVVLPLGLEGMHLVAGASGSAAASVRPSGQAAFLYGDHVQIVGRASVTLPQPFTMGQGATVLLAQNGDVYVDPGTPLAEGSDGSIYVAGTWQAPADTSMYKWFPMSGPSLEMGVVRISGSSMDSAFGTAHASSALSWLPMTTERTLDQPLGLAVGPDGAPWVVGTGRTTDMDTGLYTNRGPGIVLTRFMP